MASSSFLVTIFLCFSFLSVNANEVTVGGKSGDWKIPPSSSYSFNEWAQKARFKVGDFLGILSKSLHLSCLILYLFLCFFRYYSVSDIVSHVVFLFSVFRYEAGKDSVLQVTREAYEKCNTTSPKATYTDGNTKVKLDQTGPVYFISGTEGHCQKGQKLRLVVVSPRVSASSPAPSPSELNDGPAVAPSPTSGAAKLTGVFGVVGLVLGFWTLF